MIGAACAAGLVLLAVLGVAGAGAAPAAPPSHPVAPPSHPVAPPSHPVAHVGRAPAAAAPTTPTAIEAQEVLPDVGAAAAGGCPVPDPSGSGGCISPAMGLLMAQVIRTFGDLPASCWDARGGDPFSDHPKGRACDYTMGRIGSYPGPADVARGWALASWLRTHHLALHVNYVIWQGTVWSAARDRDGWRPYTGGGHYASTGPTNGHYDHVHVSTAD
jgi:hypothetical protein